MTSNPAPFGFWVLGKLDGGRRRLVDAAAAFAGYASCDPRAEVYREGYLSAFTFGADFRDLLKQTGSVRGFVGPCCAPWLWLDLDFDQLGDALDATRRLVAFALARYQLLGEDDVLIFFSGSKGFHFGLPLSWRPAPSTVFHTVTRQFAERLAEQAVVKIDTGVYDRVRPFRAPNSRHPKTGLHRRRLSHDELMGLTVERIRQLAERPEPFELPAPTASDPRAVEDWHVAERQVTERAEGNAERRAAAANGSPRLNRVTLDFIRDGADQGDRHRSLFSSAANLGEFGCPPALAHALLTEKALDAGLAPSEVRRQIDCGLAHVNAAGGNGHV